jgi:hypothetical protein
VGFSAEKREWPMKIWRIRVGEKVREEVYEDYKIAQLDARDLRKKNQERVKIVGEEKPEVRVRIEKFFREDR